MRDEESHWDRGDGHRGVRSNRRHPVDELGCVVLQVEQAELVAVRRVLVGVFTENLAGPAPVSGPQLLGTDDQAHALVVVRVPLQQLLHQAYGFGPFPVFSRTSANPYAAHERPVVESDPLDPSVERLAGPCC